MNDLRDEPLQRRGAATFGEVSIWRDPDLRSSLTFLFVPVLVFLAATLVDTDVPSPIVYGLAALLVPPMFWRVVRNPEWLLAAFIVYIPLARLYVFPIGPGINATNLLMVGMFVAWIAHSRRENRSMFIKMPLTALMWTWAALSTFSFVTAFFTRGPDEFFELRFGLIRVWLDQFFVFFAFVNLIRDGAMARRIAIYLCLGSAVVTFCGFTEWIEKGDASSMEKSRLLGPLGQPNDLAAFLAYSSGPFIAMFVHHMPRLRVWIISPYLLMVARVLLGAFSRGGYIAYGVEALVALALRGKLFLACVIAVGAVFVSAFPQVLPESMVARMNETKASEGEGADGLDKSSQTRLILWDAALKMTAESPIFGKGYYTFPFLKAQYTEVEVSESDNHNMYLYITSQMGVPALLALVAVMIGIYVLSSRVYRRAENEWSRAIGMGTASMCCGVAAVNMFGSRMLDISVMGYVWIYAAVVSHLWSEVRRAPEPEDANVETSGTRT